KADKYAGAIAIVIGLHLIDLKQLTILGDGKDVAYLILAMFSLVTLGVSLCLALLSFRVRGYMSYPVGNTLIDELQDEKITDEAARIRVAKMYLNAHDANSYINDQRARLLSYSGILLVIGFSLAVVTYLVGGM